MLKIINEKMKTFKIFYENLYKIKNKICKGEFEFDTDVWDEVSEKAKDLIKKLLTLDISKRITAEEAFNHPWITEFTSKYTQEKPLVQQALHNLKHFRVHIILYFFI